MQLNVIDFDVDSGGYGRLVIDLPPSPGFPRGWRSRLLCSDPEAVERLAKDWLASRDVEARDRAAAGSVAKDLPDQRLGRSGLDQGGGHGATQVVGPDAGVGQSPLPATHHAGDVARPALDVALQELAARLARVEAAVDQAKQDRDQVVRERDRAQASLAVDPQQLRPLVDVLELEARQLRAANAELRQRFDDVRRALRRAGKWRAFIGPITCHGGMDAGAADAFDEIERLLPAHDVKGSGSDLHGTTKTERDKRNARVWQLNTEGLTTKQIASRLGLVESSVRSIIRAEQRKAAQADSLDTGTAGGGA